MTLIWIQRLAVLGLALAGLVGLGAAGLLLGAAYGDYRDGPSPIEAATQETSRAEASILPAAGTGSVQ